MAAPRAYWKGYLKLSLVTCPVAVHPASSQAEKTRFHQINRKTGNRLRQQMVDEETGRVVDKDHKGRGYELASGKYVEIEPKELEAVEIESTHTIDIDKFVPEGEIDKRYYERPYYIVPDGEIGGDAFAVIRNAMKDESRIALARIVFANREHILAIEPWGKGLLGTTLRYDYEVRDEKDVLQGDCEPARFQRDGEPRSSHIEQESRAFRCATIQGRIRARAAQAGQAQGSRQTDRAAQNGCTGIECHRLDGCAAPKREGAQGRSLA
jgi:Ku protein